MKNVKRTIPTILFLVAIVTPAAQALEVNLPGVSIDTNGLSVGDVSITEGHVEIEKSRSSAGEGTEIININNSRTDLSGSDMVAARISRSDFSRSNLSSSNYRSAQIVDSDFSRATLNGSIMQAARISRSNFSRSKISGVNLYRAKISGADFSRSNFDGSDLSGVVFENTDLSRASFVGACLYGARFINSNFSRANFTNAVLTESINTNSDFARAVMQDVDRESSCGNRRTKQSSVEVVDISRAVITTAGSILKVLSEGENSSISLTINFALDSDQLDGKAREQILEISAALSSQDLQDTAILIEGHTDSTGQVDYNQDLSFRRAVKVKSVLVNQYGIESDRLTIEGLGQSQPIASNSSSQGRALNRRVTLVNRGQL